MLVTYEKESFFMLISMPNLHHIEQMFHSLCGLRDVVGETYDEIWDVVGQTYDEIVG